MSQHIALSLFVSIMSSCDPTSLFPLVTSPCLVLVSLTGPRVLSSLYIVLFSSCAAGLTFAIETVTNLLLYIPVVLLSFCILTAVLLLIFISSGFVTP